MKPIIEVQNLSKQYKIGQKQRYLSLRDSVSNLFKFKADTKYKEKANTMLVRIEIDLQKFTK